MAEIVGQQPSMPGAIAARSIATAVTSTERNVVNEMKFDDDSARTTRYKRCEMFIDLGNKANMEGKMLPAMMHLRRASKL